jgi:hypothetical protein
MASTWESSGHRIWDARALDLADAAEVTEWAGTLNAAVGTGAFYDVDAATPDFGTDDFESDACVNFTAETSERLRTDANLISADGDWTVLFRWQTPTAATTNQHTLASMTAADGTPVLTMRLNGYGTPDTLSVDDGSNSIGLGNVALDTTMQICIVHRYTDAELDVYLDGSFVDTIAVTNADGARRIQLGHEYAGWNPEFTHDQRFQAVHFIPLALDATEVASLDTYAQTLDNDYAGGITRTITFEGLKEGSSVYLYEVAHPQIWTAGFTGIDAVDLDGAYLTFQIQGASAASDHYAWFDLDNGSDDPAVPDATGHEVDVSTGDDGADVAAAMADVLDAVTDLGAVALGAVVTVTNDRNGELEEPDDGTAPATGAAIALVQTGGDDDGTTEIDSVTSSSGDWVASYIVTTPRRATVQMLSLDYKNKRFQITLTRKDATIPAGALQVEDNVYANPS